MERKSHAHLLVNYLPKIPVSKLVNSLKGVSSRKLRTQYEKYLKQFYYKGVLWSPSYFAGFYGGAPFETIKHYIQSQNYTMIPRYLISSKLLLVFICWSALAVTA